MATDEQGAAPPRKEKGISLLIAIMTIALMVSFVSEMIIASSVQLQLSAATRDKVKAEYLAKSGLNLGVFILSLSHTLSIFRAGPDAPQPIKEPANDGPSSLWNVFKSMPPFGADTANLVQAFASAGKDKEEKKGDKGSKDDKGKSDKADKGSKEDSSSDDPFQLKGFMNEKAAEQMALFEDQFSIEITDERSKVNVNYCAQGPCDEVQQQLHRLFACHVEKAYLESKNLNVDELVTRMKEFIHDNPISNGFGDDAYKDQVPPYSLKHLPLDSVNELKLIAGWDDGMHTVFSPYLTTYPFLTVSTEKPKININTAPRELIACLIPSAMGQACAEKFTQKMQKLAKNDSHIAGDPSKLGSQLAELTCSGGADAGSGEGDGNGDPSKWFDVRSNTYRIKVKATTGDQDRILEAVVQRFDPGDEKKDEVLKKLKEKRPFRFLYWKLI